MMVKNSNSRTLFESMFLCVVKSFSIANLMQIKHTLYAYDFLFYISDASKNEYYIINTHQQAFAMTIVFSLLCVDTSVITGYFLVFLIANSDNTTKLTGLD